MKKIIIIIISLITFSAKAQIITLFAGGGSAALINGVPATSVSIEDPVGGIFDKSGNYYFASDLGGNQILKIDTANRIYIVAGSGMSGFSGDLGQATAAKLYLPNSVAFDAVGNLFVCDAGNNRIRKVDISSGVITTIAGNSGTGGFSGDHGPATAAMLYGPSDICFDKFGNLYIADATNQRIRKVSSSGVITTIAGTGIPGSTGDNGPATAADIHLPMALATDDTGNIFFAGGDHLVRKIILSGIISTVAGKNGYYAYTGDGNPAVGTPIDPVKIGIDRNNELFIADYLNFRVFHVTHNGVIFTIAGNGIQGFTGEGGPATNAELNYPSGIVFDTCGNLFVPTTDGHISEVLINPPCWRTAVPSESLLPNCIYPNPSSTELHVDNMRASTKYIILNITGIIEQRGTLNPHCS